MTADRHTRPRVTVRPTPAQRAAWLAFAEAAGVTLNELLCFAVDAMIETTKKETDI